jgi:two-component system CheB/CheR fusion protein
MTKPGKARRILIVEVNPDTAQSLTELLRSLGHEVELAMDGESARQAASRATPDMVILDVRLPDCDGWELAREIRSRHQAAPIVSMSEAGDRDKRRAFDAGCDYHLLKPLNLPYLQNLLSQL